MPRRPRLNIPHELQHVIQRGNNRQACFLCSKDHYYFLDKLKEYSQKYSVSIHTYVLMTNHVHLLVSSELPNGVSLMMQSIGRSYVRYFNDKMKRTGTLWEGRFKSSLVDSDAYFFAVSRYIELNPVRAKMVEFPEQYKWSSYRSNALGEKNELITPHQNLQTLGNDKSTRLLNYQDLFEDKLPTRMLNKIRNSVNKSQPLGGTGFIHKLTQATGAKITLETHGGDRRSKDYRENKESDPLK